MRAWARRWTRTWTRSTTRWTQHSKSCLVQQISAGAASHELLGDCVTSRTVKGKEERVKKNTRNHVLTRKKCKTKTKSSINIDWYECGLVYHKGIN